MRPINESAPRILTSEALSDQQPAVDEARSTEVLPPHFQEDLEQLVTILFYELFTKNERLATPAGEIRWRERTEEPGVYGAEIGRDEIPPVKGTRFALCEPLDEFCAHVTREWTDRGAGMELCWSIQRTAAKMPDGANVFRVTIVRIETDQEPQLRAMPEVVTVANSNDSGMAIALAMINLSGSDVAAAHRELFAHRY